MRLKQAWEILALTAGVVGVSGCSGGGGSDGTDSVETGSTSADTGGCPVGSPGCACTPGGSCDPPLMCVGDYCVDPNCPVGAKGCPCTGGGVCDPGLQCNDGYCVDMGGTTASDTTMTVTDSMGTMDTSVTATDSTTMSTTGVTSTDSTGGETDTGGVDLDDWTKRRPILINNTLNKTLDDFQVMVTVEYDSDMKNDFSDLRFTNEAATEELPYWIERSTQPVDALLFVRAPSLAANDTTTIYMYYGNPAATAGSDGDSTFYFFDDFVADNLDANKWTATGALNLDFDNLNVDSGSVYSNDQVIHQPNVLLETRVMWTESAVEVSGISINAAQGALALFPGMRAYSRITIGGGTGMMQLFPNQTLVDAAMNQWHFVGMAVDETSLHFIHNRVGVKEVFPGQLGMDDHYVYLGHIYGSDGGTTNVDDVSFDFVLARGFAVPEPTTFVGGEEDAP